jgi:hypothetical protein
MTRKKGNHRHAFRFRVGTKDDPKIITCWAKVKPAKTDVYLPLKAAHVQRSIGLRGVGNSQTCTMAVCASQEKENFPHPVEGYIDWFYHRAYVVSKLDKNGLPIECYAYAHSDQIAQLNDTKGGQQKLLSQLLAEGDRVIHLRPIPKDKRAGHRPPSGRRDGSRTRVQSRGAKLRFAVAQMGGIAA